MTEPPREEASSQSRVPTGSHLPRIPFEEGYRFISGHTRLSQAAATSAVGAAAGDALVRGTVLFRQRLRSR
jgi:hypothetical protein